MQILAIRGSNLASLAGSFEVNFNTGVLADAGIFAITGPTGAGKSTLLDAISLALFDTIPRLESASKTGQITQDEIGPQDPRAILRHGSGHGFAELDFIGRDGRSYRSRWAVRRARDRAEGKLQTSTLDLECLDTGERLGGKKTETKAEILRLVGLNAQQFGRAVVLAQGEFEAFIKADGDERAQLLEKLTGADIYSRVGRIAFEKARDVRAGYDTLERQIAAMNGLDTEARQSLEEERQAAKVAHDEKLAICEQFQTAQDWHDKLSDLKAKRDAASQACEAARQACDNAAPRFTALERHKQALTHMAAWERIKDTEGRVRQAEDAAFQARQTEQSVSDAMACAENELETATQALDAAKSAQQDAAAALHEARQLDMELKHVTEGLDLATKSLSKQTNIFQSADTASRKITQTVLDVQLRKNKLTAWLREHSNLAKLSPFEADLISDFKAHATLLSQRSGLEEAEHQAGCQHLEAVTQIRNAKEALENTAQALKSSEEETRQAEEDLPRPEHFEHLTLSLRALEAIQRINLEVNRLHEDVQNSETNYGKTVDDIQRLTAEDADYQSELTQLETEIPILSAILKEAKRSEEHCRNTTSDAAMMMRAALVEGEPCPVCGATAHHLDALDAMLGGAVEAARKRTDDAATALEIVRDRATVVATLSETVREQLRNLYDQQHHQNIAKEACQAAWTSGVEQLERECRAYGLDNKLSGQALTDETQKRLTALSQEQAALHAKMQSLDEVRAAERIARTHHDTARQAHEHAETHYRVAEDRMKEARQLRLQADAEQTRLEKCLDDRLSDVIAWRDLSEDPVMWLSRTLAAWRQRTDALSQLESDWPSLHAAHVRAEGEVQAARRSLAEIQADWQARSDVYQVLLQRRSGLLDGQPVDNVVEALAGAVKVAEDAFQKAQNARNAASELAGGARARREGAEKLFEETRKELVHLGESFDGRLIHDGFSRADIGEAEALGVDYATSEERALFELNKAHSDACAALKPRESDYAQHEASRQAVFEIADLEEQLLQAKAAVADAQTVLTRLEARIIQDDETRFHTAELRAQLAAKRADGHVWERLGEMLGDAQGKRFRNFAQSLTLDHLLDFANERLADLKPRYTLQRAPAGEMLIEVIDNDMGGLVRGLQNLSGGERFLVSLALALGLSEMSTGRGIRIESLFIDEGFGALDSASLGQAVAVLEHLQAQGRRVGVISHVEELKERIPVKIEVTPLSGGKSQIAIVVD